MVKRRGRGLAALGPGGVWGVRILALSVFALVCWLWGGRAWESLAARAHASAARETGPEVDLRRVGCRAAPEWFERDFALAVLRDLEPRLHGAGRDGRIGILDDAGARDLLRTLNRSPWVAEARLERRWPDRFGLALDLRRPVLEVREGEPPLPVCAVDRRGAVLPPVPDAGLPFTVLRDPWPGIRGRSIRSGTTHPDPRVHAAAEVAVEWRDRIDPLVPDAPELVEVDAYNLLERKLRGLRHAEIRVVLRRADGGTTAFAYGRPPSTSRSRVPTATKAEVLRTVLGEFPGLGELTGGDLRLVNRWRAWLLPRVVDEDPIGWEESGRGPGGG